MGLGQLTPPFQGTGTSTPLIGFQQDVSNASGYGANTWFEGVQVVWGAPGSFNQIAKAGGELPTQQCPKLFDFAATSFTRPANTTAYAIGNAVANSTTAGSVTPVSFTVNDLSGGPTFVHSCKVDSTSANLAGVSFKLWLFTASPTPAAGDGAAFNASKANFLGSMTGSFETLVSSAFSDGGVAILAPTTNTGLIATPSAAAFFGLIQTLSVFTPTSAATFTLTLKGYPGRA